MYKYHILYKFYKIYKKIKFYVYSKVLSGSKSAGVNYRIYGDFYLICREKFEFGDNLSINQGVYINAEGGISVGNNVSLSAGSMLISTELKYSESDLSNHTYAPIIIGNNVQIGAGAIVLSGVCICDGVIVGAGALVCKNIEEAGVYVGVPTKMLKRNVHD